MIIIISLIWLLLSIYTIYYTDHYYYWKHLFKVFIITTVLAFIFNVWQVYNPDLNRMLVTIELNPTWGLALALAFAEGICITGPIAGLHILKEKIQERRG